VYSSVHKYHLHSIRDSDVSGSDSVLTTDWTTLDMQFSSLGQTGILVFHNTSLVPGLPSINFVYCNAIVSDGPKRISFLAHRHSYRSYLKTVFLNVELRQQIQYSVPPLSIIFTHGNK
jgi:hypothetical protein